MVSRARQYHYAESDRRTTLSQHQRETESDRDALSLDHTGHADFIDLIKTTECVAGMPVKPHSKAYSAGITQQGSFSWDHQISSPTSLMVRAAAV